MDVESVTDIVSTIQEYVTDIVSSVQDSVIATTQYFSNTCDPVTPDYFIVFNFFWKILFPNDVIRPLTILISVKKSRPKVDTDNFST